MKQLQLLWTHRLLAISSLCALAAATLVQPTQYTLILWTLPFVAWAAAWSRSRGWMHAYLFSTAVAILFAVVIEKNTALLLFSLLTSLAAWYLEDVAWRTRKLTNPVYRPYFIPLLITAATTTFLYFIINARLLTLNPRWLMLIALVLIVSLFLTLRFLRRINL